MQPMLTRAFLLGAIAVGLVYAVYQHRQHLEPDSYSTDRWVIFDFDGTVGHTHNLMIQGVNHFAPLYGYEPIAEQEVPSLRERSTRDLVQNRLHIHWYQLPFFHYRLKRWGASKFSQVHPFPGIREALQAIRKAGYKIGVVSSNSQLFITNFFKRHQLPMFDGLEEASVFGKHHALKKCRFNYRIDPKNVIYIGDEARDIEAAQKAHMPCLVVAWGFNTENYLAKHNPAGIIKTPRDILSVVKGFLPS